MNIFWSSLISRLLSSSYPTTHIRESNLHNHFCLSNSHTLLRSTTTVPMRYGNGNCLKIRVSNDDGVGDRVRIVARKK